jgi:hypothetical protein
VLIGLAAVLLMALNGRIAGISGVDDGVLLPMRDGFSSKLAFALGRILAPLLYALAAGSMPSTEYPHGLALVLAGGLLVGFGARVGSGCTSGHGVCGLSAIGDPEPVLFVAAMLAGTGQSRLAPPNPA